MSGPPAGWYPDPDMAGTQRYWSGGEWSDHVAPLAASPQAAEAAGNPNVEALGLVLALLFPIAGFVIGLTQLNRPGNSGVTIILLSLGATVFWLYAFYGL